MSNVPHRVRVAVQTAMGILQPDLAAGGVHRRLRWMLVEDLWRFFELDLGRGDAPIQCHALTAISRLLDRGTSGEHERTQDIGPEQFHPPEQYHPRDAGQK